MPASDKPTPAITQEQIKQMEQFVRLWGKLGKEQALALLAAYKADVYPTAPPAAPL